MTLLELVESLDERGIGIEVKATFVRSEAHAPTMADAEAAKPYRSELIRIALARQAMALVLELEKTYAGYPGRRTSEFEDRINRIKADVLYLLPEGVPWSVVAGKRSDGTMVQAPELIGAA